MPVTLRSTCSSCPARSASTVTVFTVGRQTRVRTFGRWAHHQARHERMLAESPTSFAARDPSRPTDHVLDVTWDCGPAAWAAAAAIGRRTVGGGTLARRGAHAAAQLRHPTVGGLTCF